MGPVKLFHSLPITSDLQYSNQTLDAHLTHIGSYESVPSWLTKGYALSEVAALFYCSKETEDRKRWKALQVQGFLVYGITLYTERKGISVYKNLLQYPLFL